LLHKGAQSDRQEIVYKYDYCETEKIEPLDDTIHVNVADKMKAYPRRAIECAERALFNLVLKYPHYEYV